ncbi:MAG: glycine--tRNA ligase subunit beta [Simkaniaceae bacterium]|nr:glycine--tRNA ligase subunit beta [Simkaniaceae bacterium]
MMTFQEIISRLLRFWAEHGCILHQGHDVEVGAGTFNPATFLRALGPEPYNAVYVEPSRRPQDGRYGENPNRLQLFHQLQVIMKPAPTNIQQLYLESLRVIGFDLSKHDVRFVHDDWESPTLGAWGLGWEVWIDGMEVTQFTYFQSVAGFPTKPIPVELTYGLERLCMFIQKVDNFFDMQYNETLTYGQVYHRNELEWSRYNYDHANTSMWLRHFEDYEREAKYLIESNLPLPAYDFVMKASHAFNILEARGMLSTTERTNYIHRIRDLSRLAATEFLATRQLQGFPLLKPNPPEEDVKQIAELPESFDPEKKSDLLFEIGSEELPATFVPIGMRNLKSAMEKLLEGISHDGIEVYGTPRRLAVEVKNLSHGTPEKKVERRGPTTAVCFDDKGLTKQGAGFARSLGIEKSFTLAEIDSIEGLEVRGEHLFANITLPGKSTFALLAEGLPKIIYSLHFPKTMRWASFDITYARPIQWVVALHGSEVIPFQIANIKSGKTTYGHAQYAPDAIELTCPSDYLSALESGYVLASVEARKERIEKELATIEQREKVVAVKKNRVLNEVLHLTEWPTLASYEFNQEFLRAPKEILISEMIEHQRYFPLENADGSLANKFVITADHKINETVLENNQHVLSARLADGVFLYENDLKAGLDSFNESLREITFHKELGSIHEKVKRICANANMLAQMLDGDQKKVARASELCKADLASSLVREFPELQGSIGKYYALAQNEDTEVASAIEEHWLPNADKGPLPQTQTGKIVSLADKIDNILSCTSIGIKATSSSDPYALRRQSFGIMRILIDNKWSLDLETLFRKIQPNKNVVSDVLAFFRNRMRSLLEEYGFRADEIEASLPKEISDPYDAYCKVEALHNFKKTETFTHLFEVYKRARGQIADELEQSIDAALLGEPSEHMLYSSLTDMRPHFDKAIEMRNYTDAFTSLAGLQKPLADLFDQVKILCDNPSIKNNRIALLQQVFSYFDQLLDFSKIKK